MSVAITSNNNKQPQPQPHLKVVNNNSTFNLYTWLRSVFQYCISLIISYTSNWLLVNNDNNININYKSNNNDNNNASTSLQPKISNVKAESMKIFPDLQRAISQLIILQKTITSRCFKTSDLFNWYY